MVTSYDHWLTKYHLSKEVKDSIKDSLRILCNYIATFADVPSNWVSNPKNKGESTTHHERTANVLTPSTCVSTRFETGLIGDVEEGSTT